MRPPDPHAPSLPALRRAALLAWVTFGAAFSPAAMAKCQLEPFEIPVTMKQSRAVAHLRINGTELPFTVDSGAEFNWMTEAAAARLNLGTRRAVREHWGLTGRIDTRVARVERLGLQNVEVKNVEFLVGVNEPGAGTVGLVGRHILGLADTEYDLGNGIVRLMHPNADCRGANLAYWAGTAPVVVVPLLSHPDEKRPAIRAEATINGKPVTVLFDTGAPSFLSLDAARRVGVVDDKTVMTPAGTVFGAGSGERPSWIVPMRTFELGAERITDSRVRVADFGTPGYADMLIGIDFFLSHRIYVARSQERLYFTYSGGPVFDLSIQPATPVQAEGHAAEAPQDAAAFARRGAALAARRELAAALADLDRAVALAPESAAYRTQRAEVKVRLGQPDAALSDLEEALRLDPDAHEARLDRAWMRRRDKGSADAVRADLLWLDQRVAPQSHLRRRMGDLYTTLGEPSSAVKQYDHWVASHPREADRYVVLGARCWARALADAELDKAIDDCDEALGARPKEASFLDSRGLVHLRRGLWKKAIADYDAALAVDPKQAWSLWGRGLARIGAGDRTEGLADLAAARAARASIEAEAGRHGLAAPKAPP